MKVEFLVAWPDHTWSTVTCEVPVYNNRWPIKTHHEIVAWANEELAKRPLFCNAVLFAILSVPEG